MIYQLFYNPIISEGLAPDYHDGSLDVKPPVDSNPPVETPQEAPEAVKDLFGDTQDSILRRKKQRHDAPRSKHLPKVIIIGVKKLGLKYQ